MYDLQYTFYYKGRKDYTNLGTSTEIIYYKWRLAFLNGS